MRSHRAAPRVSFVVLCHNSGRVVEPCVRSLIAQMPPDCPDEIWVVDNGSSDNSPEVLGRLRKEFGDVLKVERLDRNRGTTISRNLALRRAAGQYVAVVDSDVCVPPGTVDTLIAHLAADPGAGLIAPRLMYPSGQLQLSVDQFPTLIHKTKRFLALKAMERQAHRRQPLDRVQAVDYAISAFWLIPRHVLDTVGLLDERIFYAPEDVDYCLRVWQAGYRVLYDPTVHAVHHAQEISRGLPVRAIALSHIAGLLYLYRKHRFVLSRRGLYRRIGRHDHAVPLRHNAHDPSVVAEAPWPAASAAANSQPSGRTYVWNRRRRSN